MAKRVTNALKFLLELVESSHDVSLLELIERAVKKADAEVPDPTAKELFDKFMGALIAEFKTCS